MDSIKVENFISAGKLLAAQRIILPRSQQNNCLVRCVMTCPKSYKKNNKLGVIKFGTAEETSINISLILLSKKLSTIKQTMKHILANKYFSADQTHKMHGEEDKCIEAFGWKNAGKRPLGRPRRIWEDNITTNLKQDRRA